MIGTEYNDFIYSLSSSTLGLIDDSIFSISADKRDSDILVKLIVSKEKVQYNSTLELMEQEIKASFTDHNIIFKVIPINEEKFMKNEIPMLRYGIFLRSKY